MKEIDKTIQILLKSDDLYDVDAAISLSSKITPISYILLNISYIIFSVTLSLFYLYPILRNTNTLSDKHHIYIVLVSFISFSLIVGLPYVRVWQMRSEIRRHRKTMPSPILTLSKAGIRAEQGECFSVVPWSSVQNIVKRGDKSILQTGPLSSYAIPHASLPADVSPEDLLKLANSYVAAARTAS
ncbi:MAG: hypothetical protein KDJ53_01590 [Rhodobiaceae bacterium]|nr:hypothetical protein [Rhodobiaceae bacterium]